MEIPRGVQEVPQLADAAALLFTLDGDVTSGGH